MAADLLDIATQAVFSSGSSVLAGGASGWVIANIFKGMYQTKDKENTDNLKKQVDLMQQSFNEHLTTVRDETRDCNQRYNILLAEVLRIRDGRPHGA